MQRLKNTKPQLFPKRSLMICTPH